MFVLVMSIFIVVVRGHGSEPVLISGHVLGLRHVELYI